MSVLRDNIRGLVPATAA